MIKPLVSLLGISLVCAVLLATTRAQTADPIQANREARNWRLAFDLVGTFDTANRDFESHTLTLEDGSRLVRGTVAGYAGDIGLLAALDGQQRLIGVRVTRHSETPGLGDFIDTERSPWIRQFADRRPASVDSVTGATITSQAVKRGVQKLVRGEQ